MVRPVLPLILDPESTPSFPDPKLADSHGLIAAGGALTPAWLLLAYQRGIFPWYDADMPPLWWSPDPRAVLDPQALHVSRSMRRFARTTGLKLTFDAAFAGVIRACSEREEGTWILPETIDAYDELFRLGHAHSVEVWNDGKLVGGLYGVQRGGLFAAESMFHRETNASKLALIAAVRALFEAGISLFDVQFPTSHLTSLGVYTVSRREYLSRLSRAVATPVSLASVPERLSAALAECG